MLKLTILTIGAFGLIMLAMAVGVIFQGKTLKGSCGGVGSSCACDEAGEPVCDSKKLRDATATASEPSH
ncbi:MAG: (Na+)-NQR maturation NqrM [Myxococcales bacterium]|nr:(Na+)-NQR maturation NqrM [Myxococcales bacterium]